MNQREYDAMIVEKVRHGDEIQDLVEAHEGALVMRGKTVAGTSFTRPSLVLRRVVTIPTSKKPVVLGRVGLFTKTTKMRALSFSLPAGPLKYYGTCIQAGNKTLLVGDVPFVCHGCYAVSGKYGHKSVQFCALSRRQWVVDQLRAGTLADSFSEALEYEFSHLRPGYSAEYFRIHDAGDMLWADTVKLPVGRPRYFEVWCEVCRRFPHTTFWAPTRDWVIESWHDCVVRRPSNFILRPSTLYAGTAAPYVDGFDGGTSVAFGAEEELQDAGIAELQCPAYLGKTTKHNCADARCRVCWEVPEMRINYKPHGRVKKPKVKKNPGRGGLTELTALYDEYVESGHGVRHNPRVAASDIASGGFHAWLIGNDEDPDVYDEGTWMAFLETTGVHDDDEKVALLEGLGEYQL